MGTVRLFEHKDDPLDDAARPIRRGAAASLMASTAWRLLVSIPTLHDPNFFRSVVFMIEHTDEGALGLVLNQPTETRVDDVLDAWAPYAAAPAVAFVGGPVQQHDAVIGLARVGTVRRRRSDPGDGDAWQPLIGRIGTVDLGRDPHDARADLEAVRIFAGYSGWGPSQLEGEIDAGGWFVVDAHADDLLTSDPGRAVAHRVAPPGWRPRGVGELSARRRGPGGQLASTDACRRHRRHRRCRTHPGRHRAPRRRRLRERRFGGALDRRRHRGVVLHLHQR